ncbi:MAG: hypothetical protein AAGG01_18105 [Planctomycetota bacterium]
MSPSTPALVIAALAAAVPAAHAQSRPLHEVGIAGAPSVHTRHSIDRVHITQLSADQIQVRGRSYKAEFQPGMATVAPFLGSDAPRTETLRFELTSVTYGGVVQPIDRTAAPKAEGHDVVYRRGPIDERYHLRLMEAEQTFVIQDPVNGAIEVEVALDSTLERHPAEDGWLFSTGDRGMKMSHAFAVDGRGVTVPLETEFDDGSYTIRVDESTVAKASFPLTIDPILSTFGVDDFDIMLTEPRVAHHEPSNTFYFAYQENFSVFQSDVYGRLMTPQGNIVSDGYIWSSASGRNISHDMATGGPLAGNSGLILVASIFDSGSGTAGNAVSRVFDPQTSSLTPEVQLNSTSLQGPLSELVVGGSRAGRYIVAWTLTRPSGDHDIQGRLVNADGSVPPGATIGFGPSGDDLTRPDVAEDAGTFNVVDTHWTVVAERAAGGTTSVWATQLNFLGSLRHPLFPISAAGASSPKIASAFDKDGPVELTVVYEQQNGSQVDLMATVVSDGTSTTPVNLSGEILGTSSFQGGRIRDIDSNGSRMTLGWTDGPAGSDSSYLSTIAYVDGEFLGLDSVRLGNAFLSAITDVVSARTSNEDHLYVIAYEDRQLPGNTNPRAAIYSDTGEGPGANYCQAAPNSTGGRARLTGTGTGVAGSDLTLTTSGMPLNSFGFYIVGTEATPPVVPPLSQGRICIGGTIGRYQAQAQSSGASGSISLVVDTNAIPLNPFRPAVAGETLFFQTWYRDANPHLTSNFSEVYFVTFR